MAKGNTFLPYIFILFILILCLFFKIFGSVPALKCRTKHKGLPAAGSNSEEDPDSDSTGILGQRAARQRAAAAQVPVSIYLPC